MQNQHQHIKGYRDLSQAEIDLMNEIKAKAAETGDLIARLDRMGNAHAEETRKLVDLRWLSIARTDLQKGFMSLVRAVAQPASF